MKKAYVTMLCNGDGYVTGAEVLAKSLDASGSTVPRIAMVTTDISPAARARSLSSTPTHWCSRTSTISSSAPVSRRRPTSSYPIDSTPA